MNRPRCAFTVITEIPSSWAICLFMPPASATVCASQPAARTSRDHRFAERGVLVDDEYDRHGVTLAFLVFR
jgi:hypothetical protein